MKKIRLVSILMLAFSGFTGLVRGYRMMCTTSGDTILFPYGEEAIRLSMFSSYRLLGGILFGLIGVFSLYTLLITILRKSYYGYLIIVEGIFLTFFGIAHIVFNGLMVANIAQIVFCVALLTLAFFQTPKEF